MPIIGAELGAEKDILRLVRKIAQFVPDGRPPLNGEAFAPTTDDEAEAKRHSQPIRVSVWDIQLTTIEQAKAFRTSELLLAFILTVQDVNDVRQIFHLPRLKVVADPLNDPRPGAIGHCGIEGLDRQSGEGRKTYKATRDELARRAKLREETSGAH
jgi:hypothetical protein